jgi:hypothetical protein
MALNKASFCLGTYPVVTASLALAAIMPLSKTSRFLLAYLVEVETIAAHVVTALVFTTGTGLSALNAGTFLVTFGKRTAEQGGRKGKPNKSIRVKLHR